MPDDPDQFRVKVAGVGICGSDLHLIDVGLAEGRVLGHEIAGYLDDGTPVAVEPLRSCGHCGNCTEGERHRCEAGADIIGSSATEVWASTCWPRKNRWSACRADKGGGGVAGGESGGGSSRGEQSSDAVG